MRRHFKDRGIRIAHSRDSDGTARAHDGSTLGMTATETMTLAINLTEAFRDLVQIGIALTSERDLSTLLHRILTEARRFTRAEADTLFLRENDELHFAVVQNDRLARRLGDAEMQRLLQSQPLKLSELSLAGHVPMMGEIVNIPDTYTVPSDRPYSFDPLFDAR